MHNLVDSIRVRVGEVMEFLLYVLAKTTTFYPRVLLSDTGYRIAFATAHFIFSSTINLFLAFNNR